MLKLLIAIGAGFVAYRYVYMLMLRTTQGYDYKFEYKGDHAISKYKFIVYYNGKIIHTDNYHDTSLFGYPKMMVQALSHQRRKGM